MPSVDSSNVQTTDYKPHPSETMRAARWTGTKSIELGTVPKPMITAPKDAIVRVTHCTICGSDLHMYAGELNSGMQKGDIMGHEAIGIVEDIGPQVSKIKKGDRVIILPVIACGDCFYCQRQEYSLCDSTNPSKEMENMWGHRLSGIFGYSHLTGGYPGDQAEWCRVPNADLTCVKAPMDVDARKLVALADVTPTAWHGCELAEVTKGDVVGVWGCGAIGLSIQKLSLFRGARKVYAIDKDPQRLKIAASFGAIPVNINDHTDVAAYILSVEPHGLDRGIEASGFRSETSVTHTLMRKVGLEGDQGDTVTSIITATRKCGNIALIGDFFFNTNQFPIGMLMEKTITLRGADKQYFPYLLDIVVSGEYDPSFVMTHTDDFENVSKNYASFNDHKIPGGLKVCLVTEFGRS
ncbi:alcohol dehydrogenase GroES-like domain-containing protein [Aureobasidium pullulans]|uniref:Alcohol dehydrogenase GroES-like domain-containing protein n=1 Tax=Aureobasidium pullulans TaxID=5580 RepID=A0A4V6TET2_AURPU|nr:alcohol dehydrogenase GroES-like domain-containing protein [Aureobasidium pullulans]